MQFACSKKFSNATLYIFLLNTSQYIQEFIHSLNIGSLHICIFIENAWCMLKKYKVASEYLFRYSWIMNTLQFHFQEEEKGKWCNK